MLVENNLIDAAKSLDGAKQEIENKLRTTGLTSINAYGILSSSIHEFNIYNKSNYLGLLFLIDENGILQKEWRNVSVMGHVKAVLNAI